MNKTSLQLLSALAFTLLSIGVSDAATVYKCKNEQGKLLYQKTPCIEIAQAAGSWTPNTYVKQPEQEPVKKSTTVLVIRQGAGGHYFLNGEVNSHGINFVVDTGATLVSLPETFATSASLYCNDRVKMDTANGVSNGCTTVISELKIGDFVLKKVTALIVPSLSQPLLGMNVLQGFNIEQKNGEMKLSERDAK